MFGKEKDILVHKLKALESKDAHTELNKLFDELAKALSEKERELKQVVLEQYHLQQAADGVLQIHGQPPE
ncbi:hypothetical protein GBF38_006613 [Nibea albiflora]|uniref:Uncharacterized protein n=1 Tax=Nibea albiflora TaxID=240163 RepID=A0ACB7EFU9_NIBAL|nr:hypothetical protein GBF38_006613 [Nibea albiflora]